MTLARGFRDYLADLLAPLGRLEAKRFFGLDGVKVGGAMLGFVLDEKLYLRTDDESRASYVDEGMKPFSFTTKSGEVIVTSYYAMPDRLFDEPDEFLRWARHAHAAALETPSAKQRRAKRQRDAERAVGGPTKTPRAGRPAGSTSRPVSRRKPRTRRRRSG